MYLLRKERYLQISKLCGGEIKGALSEQKKNLSPRAGKGLVIYTQWTVGRSEAVGLYLAFCLGYCVFGI